MAGLTRTRSCGRRSRMASMDSKMKFLFAAMVLAGAFQLASGFGAGEDARLSVSDSSRGTLSAASEYEEGFCDSSFNTNGGIVIYIFGIIMTFVGIAAVADDYFTAALEVIVERLELSEDVAGATFMAAGSSAPELATSVMATFSSGGGAGLGVGTIVGSALFNLLVIVGVVSFSSAEPLELDWRPLTRDSTFYALSIIMLGVFFSDGLMEFWESGLLVLLYVFYVLYMMVGNKMWALCGISCIKVPKDNEEDEAPSAISAATEDPEALGEASTKRTRKRSSTQTAVELLEASRNRSRSRSSSNAAALISGAARTGNSDPEEHRHPVHEIVDIEAIATDLINNPGNDTTEDLAEEEGGEPAEKKLFAMPRTATGWLVLIFVAPWLKVFSWTIPDCRDPEKEKYYMGTLGMSVVWIGILTYFMVEWATKFSCIVGLSAELTGLTLLAAGTSAPDCISSVLVAREGLGDMAVSNALGSNVFDITLCLGLVFLVHTMIFGEAYVVDPDGIIESIFVLFGVLIAFLLVLIVSKFKLSPKAGIPFILFYVAYVVYALVK